jgi:hypothetical protein
MEPPQPATEVEPQQPAAEAGPQQPAAEAEPHPAAPMTAANTAVAVAMPPTSPVPAAAAGLGAAVVEIPNDNDDVPPSGWDQSASAPASAPEALAGALVAHGGTSAVLGRLADGVGPSSSRAGPAAYLEQGQEGADAPPAQHIDAQAEQGLWEELRDHDASLNWALNEALWTHGGPACHTFQVS